MYSVVQQQYFQRLLYVYYLLWAMIDKATTILDLVTGLSDWKLYNTVCQKC